MSSHIDAGTAAGHRPFSFSGTNSASYLNEQQPQLQRTNQAQQQHQQQRPHTSRFVEGSMNDRTSRAPPVSYLGGVASGSSRSRSRSRDNSFDGNRDDPYAHREYHNSTRRSLQMARPSLSMFRTPNTNSSSETSASITSTNTANTTATDATASSNTSSLRRPRSFLGPIWDGMTKRLHRRTRSTVEADMAKKSEQEQQQQRKAQPPMGASHVTLPGTDRPSPDEVFANYQQLMQAGFFNKRAIPATREGLASRGANNNGGSTTSGPAAVAACPDRPPPPPPPKSAPWMNGTPLSPVAPSPSGLSTSTTPRGTKRGRAPADDGEDADDTHLNDTITKAGRGSARDRTGAPSASPTRTSPRKISKKLRKAPSIRSTPGLDGSVRSLRSMHNASAAAAAAAEAEYNETVISRPSTAYTANGSMASSSRSTRSHTTHAPVQVYQPLPPLPTSIDVAPMPPSTEKRIVSKKRKETSRTASLEIERNGQHTSQVVAAPAEQRTSSSQEPKRKKRSQGPAAVVHQGCHKSGSENVMALEDVSNKEADAKESQDALRPPPTTHYHRHLGPLNPATQNRGGNGTKSSVSGRAGLNTISPATSQQQQQERQKAPISFHYPQRVRVRRPAQAQDVEMKATSKADVNGKSLLFREEDTENQIPVWQN